MLRRRFLNSLGEAGGAALVTTLFGPETISRVEAATKRLPAAQTPEERATDESYWAEVQQALGMPRRWVMRGSGMVKP